MIDDIAAMDHEEIRRLVIAFRILDFELEGERVLGDEESMILIERCRQCSRQNGIETGGRVPQGYAGRLGKVLPTQDLQTFFISIRLRQSEQAAALGKSFPMPLFIDRHAAEVGLGEGGIDHPNRRGEWFCDSLKMEGAAIHMQTIRTPVL